MILFSRTFETRFSPAQLKQLAVQMRRTERFRIQVITSLTATGRAMTYLQQMQ